MHRFLALALALSFALVVGLKAEGPSKTIKSGPQVGEELPGPFHPLNVTGEAAGKKNCLYCSNGTNPVAMIFAREVTPSVAKLVKRIDEVTVKNAGCDMGSFVVFLTSDSDKMEKELKTMADKEGLKKIVLAIDNPAGPTKYNVAKEADVTVVLYVNHIAKANFTFAKASDISDKDIDAIVSDVSKITKK